MKETTTASKTLYKGKFLEFIEDDVDIDVSPVIKAKRQYFIHPGGVCVIPVLDDGSVVLVEQYRTPINKAILEIPAGKRDPGETPIETAQRELKEETGYTAKTWIDLGVIYPCPGYATEVLYIYLAKDLKAGPTNLDHGEIVSCHIMPVDKILDLIHAGDLRDAKTISAIMLGMKYIN